jgi:hypothetical protein
LGLILLEAMHLLVKTIDLFYYKTKVGQFMDFIFNLHEIKISNDELITDIKRVAILLNKKTVTMREYNEHGKYHSCTLRRRFYSWFNVLENAGLEKSRSEFNIDNKLLLKNLADVWTKLGRQPNVKEMKKPLSKYGAQTYLRHFDSWNNALIEFMKTLKTKNIINQGQKYQNDCEEDPIEK